MIWTLDSCKCGRFIVFLDYLDGLALFAVLEGPKGRVAGRPVGRSRGLPAGLLRGCTVCRGHNRRQMFKIKVTEFSWTLN